MGYLKVMKEYYGKKKNRLSQKIETMNHKLIINRNYGQKIPKNLPFERTSW